MITIEHPLIVILSQDEAHRLAGELQRAIEESTDHELPFPITIASVKTGKLEVFVNPPPRPTPSPQPDDGA